MPIALRLAALLILGLVFVTGLRQLVFPADVLGTATVAQIESAMTFGLGAALIEQITVRNGVVPQTNFHEYRVTRMSGMPLMDVKVISTDNKPTGIDEAGVPVVAPAIANAVAVLTGKRLRHLPMTPDRVKCGLA